MNEMKVYDTMECMKLVKKIYPWIPIFIIRRVLYAEEVYMHKIGIISWKPILESWIFTKKQQKLDKLLQKKES